MSSPFRSMILAALGSCLFAAPASAYLDPGTGSYVFQMAAAALVSLAFVLRSQWQRLKSFIVRQPPPPLPPSDRSADGH